jgi:hypothetical protein
MDSDRSVSPSNWASGINVLAGIWLIISPWVLSFGGHPTAVWNSVILGIVVLLFALGAMSSKFSGPSWWNVVFGIWLIISPWVLGFASLSTAATNAVVLGIIVLILALVAATAKAAPGRRTTA